MLKPAPTVVGYRAVGRLDGVIVATTTNAVRVDHDDRSPELWFPAADVHLDGLPDDLWRRGRGDVDGFVPFDSASINVVLVDRRPANPNGTATYKRFPTWGDAADLVAVLDVRPDGDGRYIGVARSRLATSGRRGQPDPRAGDRRRRPPLAGPACRRRRRWFSPRAADAR